VSAARNASDGCETTPVASIERLGDAALLLRFGDCVDAATNARVHAWATALSLQKPDWLIDITPAYANLALHVDVACIGERDPFGIDPFKSDPLDAAHAWLTHRLAEPLIDSNIAAARVVDVPVLYGGEHGPDLAALAAHASTTIEDTIARHTAGNYSVAMLGFAPGFPYLLGLDATLAMPRLSTPRTNVAGGSVGIGGMQTGIYPRAGPGGWRLIGCTPLHLFDARRDPPGLLQAGDHVRFVAIDSATFDAMNVPAR
jgi:KipI family sensor histidine kinase inhibitor